MKFVQPIRDRDKIEEIKSVLRMQSERNYIMFVLGINSGLRISDLLRVRVIDIRGMDHLSIKEKKTKKEKLILINPTLKRALKTYTQKMGDDEYLIQSREGENRPLSRITAYQILKKVAKKCGLRGIGTHTMRKTYGYFHYQKYKDVAALMKRFGHSEMSITLRYIGIDQDMQDKNDRNFGL